MKNLTKLNPSIFDNNTKLVSVGKLDQEKISFIKKIDKQFAEQLDSDTDILFWENRLKHIEKHRDDFASDSLYETCLENIPNIIQNPDYIGIHHKNKSLLFIKDYSQHVLIAIRVSTEGKMSFRTMYPLMESQLENYIKKGTCKNFLTK